MNQASNRVRIKFCGITRKADALAAVALGVDALGFVFYEPSPRYVDPVEAADIIAALPPMVSKIGLFVNAAPKVVEATIAATRIDCVQFHGDEPVEDCRRVSRPWIKAVRVRTSGDVTDAVAHYTDAAALLLDRYDPDVYGGSGRAFDWTLSPTNAAVPIIVAGGLTPDNVARAIQRTRPFAVDVSGGIEARKGVKDYEKMQKFIDEVKHGECQI